MTRQFKGIEVEVVRGQVQVYDFCVPVEKFEASVENAYEEWIALDDADRELYADFEEFFDEVYHEECYPED